MDNQNIAEENKYIGFKIFGIDNFVWFEEKNVHRNHTYEFIECWNGKCIGKDIEYLRIKYESIQSELRTNQIIN